MSGFSADEMYVIKRNGDKEIVSFDKILQRIKKTGQEANINLNYTSLAMKVIDQLYDGITTTQIDELTADQCASLASTHPDYSTLAGRIIVSNHQKNTSASFSEVMVQLYQYKDKHAKHSPLVSDEVYHIVQEYGATLDQMVDYSRDYLIDFFGFKTLDRAYMMKLNKVTVERPQHMWLRVAIGIHASKVIGEDGTASYTVDIDRVRETYDAMSNKYFTHATPTLFNAGTPHPQLSSCFLLQLEQDSIEGIYNTLKDCAMISKWAGGIGLHIHNVRATGSHIRGTNGASNGIVPMLRVFNNTAKYVDQCVLPDTGIYTSRGVVKIRDCIAGVTQIINRQGKMETIGRVLEHAYSGPVVAIRSHLQVKPLHITLDHPIYVVQNHDLGNVVERLDRGLATMEWIEAKSVSPKDWIVYSIPQIQVLDHSDLTHDMCYLYGLLIAGMHNFQNRRIVQLSTTHIPTERLLTTHYYVAHSPEKLTEIVHLFDKYYVLHNYDSAAGTISWKQTVDLPFSRSDFYDTTGTLRLGERWQTLPLDKTQDLVDGVGIYADTGTQFFNDMVFLHLRLGTLEQCVRPELRHTVHRYRDYYLISVQTVMETHYEGLVYDLQMTQEHNYLLENGLVHNGGGKRNGSFAIYLEPWHADIEAFLQMRKNHGDEELKARDLFYALWIPDLFMERVKADGTWTLMCPDECPGLADVYGQPFADLYERYEREGKGRTTVQARQLWFQILDAQMETGTPYLVYKDAANRKSNQQNLGTIKSSNLCVAPETRILTNRGQVQIQNVAGQFVHVWNGEEFSEVQVVQTGVDQELLEVHTSDGAVLTCTPYHKFFVQGKQSTVEAQALNTGDVLRTCAQFPVIPEKVTEFKAMVDTLDTTVYDDGVYIFDENPETLFQIKLLLQSCGVNVPVRWNNGRCCIDISIDNLYVLMEHDCIPAKHPFTVHGLVNDVSSNTYRRLQSTEVRVVQVVRLGRRDRTFCFTEPKRNAGVFNGILTSQCSEIIEYSDENESAVCNLASLALPAFVKYTGPTPVFDFDKLHAMSKIVTYNLNRVIDVNYYPTEKTRRSNMRHRPIGIGVQGLADVFMMMNMPFASNEARELNRLLFETIYHAAVEQSCEMAEVEGPYETFAGSPASRGQLQFDLWDVEPTPGRYDWNALKERVKSIGLRNSLLLAPMPTASTSQILGYNECIEPITSNIYSRRTLAGEFIMANRYLMKDLIEAGVWNEKIKNNIIANHGSVQQLDMIPSEIREKYKTVWEIPMRALIDMAADRGAFICQSQSLNLWLEDPTYSTLTSMHFYSWNKGLKTGIYYLRRRGRHQAQQFTIEPEKKEGTGPIQMEDEHEICEMCSA